MAGISDLSVKQMEALQTAMYALLKERIEIEPGQIRADEGVLIIPFKKTAYAYMPMDFSVDELAMACRGYFSCEPEINNEVMTRVAGDNTWEMIRVGWVDPDKEEFGGTNAVGEKRGPFRIASMGSMWRKT